MATHHLPDSIPWGAAKIIFVTDGIEAAVVQAKAAARDRNILLHGADTPQRCLRVGLLDEMEIQLVPVLLGEVAVCSTGSVPSTSNSS